MARPWYDRPMARGRPGLPMKLQIGGETFLVVPARDVLDVHGREDARRLLERAIVDRVDLSELRSIVEELDPMSMAMSRADVLASAEALLSSGRLVGVRVRREMPALDAPEIRPLVEHDDPREPVRGRDRPQPMQDPDEPQRPFGPSVPGWPEFPPADGRTWFQARVVDGIGHPLAGIELTLEHDGSRTTLTTDADGTVRLDAAIANRAVLTIESNKALASALTEAWARPTTEPPLSPGPRLDVVHVRGSALPPVAIDAEAPHTVSVQPLVVLGRLVGMFFDTDRTFLLPMSREGLAEMVALYQRCAPCTILVVGHTDTTGQIGHNAALSLQRAQVVAEFLTDDADGWLARYGSGVPSDERWGAAEDLLMIGARTGFHERAPGEDPVRWYQRTRGLTEDGDAGPVTRRTLIAETMAADGTSLPPGVAVETHGCGEAFPLDATGHALDRAPVDGAGDPMDRRVELFFFAGDLGIQPPVPGAFSDPGSAAYPTWRWRTQETYEKVLGAQALEIVLLDEAGNPVPHARYRVELPVGAVIEGQLDAHGCARIDRLPEGACRVDFPDLPRGFALQEARPLHE